MDLHDPDPSWEIVIEPGGLSLVSDVKFLLISRFIVISLKVFFECLENREGGNAPESRYDTDGYVRSSTSSLTKEIKGEIFIFLFPQVVSLVVVPAHCDCKTSSSLKHFRRPDVEGYRSYRVCVYSGSMFFGRREGWPFSGH